MPPMRRGPLRSCQFLQGLVCVLGFEVRGLGFRVFTGVGFRVQFRSLGDFRGRFRCQRLRRCCGVCGVFSGCGFKEMLGISIRVPGSKLVGLWAFRRPSASRHNRVFFSFT